MGRVSVLPKALFLLTGCVLLLKEFGLLPTRLSATHRLFYNFTVVMGLEQRPCYNVPAGKRPYAKRARPTTQPRRALSCFWKGGYSHERPEDLACPVDAKWHHN